MKAYEIIRQQLKSEPKTWLVTGVAGFIGSNLLEALLKLNQRVVGLDNFSTGHERNLCDVKAVLTSEEWSNFQFFKGDIRNQDDCKRAMLFLSKKGGQDSHSTNESVDYVLHQAALGSVPRSIADPIASNQSNIDGFLNVLVAAKSANVKRFVYAASSSSYGDHPDLPKVEDKIGKPLSPYAVTKLVNELYADVFSKTYGIETIGLRYFNVFGRRQDPAGSYAAVIPKWIGAMLENEQVYINGDGETSRDFCYVDNVIQANLLAATATNKDAVNQVYNIAVGDRTSLNQIYYQIRDHVSASFPGLENVQPAYREFRAGDVRHSLANIEKARTFIGYEPAVRVDQGLQKAVDWYVKNLKKSK